ncbi:hypothetical protein J4461_03725 [Candidatus Pacearchaeota archaeon]|nr:hypothetical protein [Candidatus Pacearchaeota archaeon]
MEKFIINYGFAIINPWALKWEQSILDIMDSGLVKRAGTKHVENVSAEPFKVQYSHHEGKLFQRLLIESIAGNEIVFLAYVGNENFYETMKENKIEVRRRFNGQIPQPSIRECPELRFFALHCSETREEALREYNA